jgi:hypothetical protein
MELAALRTRQAKQTVRRDALFSVWHAEARGLGFELNREAVRAHASTATSRPSPSAGRDGGVAMAASKMTGALQAMNQPAAMAGLAVDLRQREWELDRT